VYFIVCSRIVLCCMVLCYCMVTVCMFAPVGKNGSADYCEGKLKNKSNETIYENHPLYLDQYSCYLFMCQ